MYANYIHIGDCDMAFIMCKQHKVLKNVMCEYKPQSVKLEIQVNFNLPQHFAQQRLLGIIMMILVHENSDDPPNITSNNCPDNMIS